MKIETIEQLAEKLAAGVPCWHESTYDGVMIHTSIESVDIEKRLVTLRSRGWDDAPSHWVVPFCTGNWCCADDVGWGSSGRHEQPTLKGLPSEWGMVKQNPPLTTEAEMREALSHSYPVTQPADFGWGSMRDNYFDDLSAKLRLVDGCTLTFPQVFIDFCEERGLLPAEVIAGFIGDLCGIEQQGPFNSHGSDERRLAMEWFERVDWAYAKRKGPQEKCERE